MDFFVLLPEANQCQVKWSKVPSKGFALSFSCRFLNEKSVKDTNHILHGLCSSEKNRLSNIYTFNRKPYPWSWIQKTMISGCCQEKIICALKVVHYHSYTWQLHCKSCSFYQIACLQNISHYNVIVSLVFSLVAQWLNTSHLYDFHNSI